MSELVRCRDAGRAFGPDVALRPTTCAVSAGARVALTGRSGSGKSTLLHLMAGLDEPTVGTVDWPALGSRAEQRAGTIGVVFQGPSLMPALTVAENVAVVLVLSGLRDAEAQERARAALATLDLADLSDKLPEEISGGQAQRAAVARALAGDPLLILADEPTGQLDRASGARVVDVLLAAAEHAGAALVVATHDPSVAARFEQRWTLRDGALATRGAAVTA